MDADANLRALMDVEAIRDLARGYAHCVWQRDSDGAVDLFAPDGVMDMGDRPLMLLPADVGADQSRRRANRHGIGYWQS